jgi:release factor glutamine methyltransferase
MGKISLKLQRKALQEMANRKPYTKKLAGFAYRVLPKVYKGSTDTELMCSLLGPLKGMDVWDIGTGTGLIALQAKRNGARHVLATDLNPDAVKNTKENSKLLGLDIDTRTADLFGNITKKFDLITFNPPFTDSKPKASHDISFWDEGHAATRKFLKGVHNHLKPQGKALIAWSSFGNTVTLKRIAKEYGVKLREIGRKKGKMRFVYYAFEIRK